MKWFQLIVLGLTGLVVAPCSKAQSGGKSEFDRQVAVEAIRKRSDRIGGGDFDDKLDRITFTVRLQNNGVKASFDEHSAEFYVFARGIVDRNSFKLLGVTKTSFSLPPRKTHEFVTEEVITRYDRTGVRFGAAYDSWVIVVRDAKGEIVKVKASSPQWADHADKLKDLQTEKFIDRNLAEVKGVR